MTNLKARSLKKLPKKCNNIAAFNNFARSQSSRNIQECVSDDSIDDKGDPDDGDNNDGDTTSSFSLQECMNEFRSRRIRRNSSHGRHFDNSSHIPDSTELDLINQNLCNKEQERKCKPCKNGFCYCFTSDSGDGVGVGSCGVPRASNVRHMRRNKRSDTNQSVLQVNTLPKTSKNHQKNNKSEAKDFEKVISKSNQVPITAISRLKTSNKNAPLIHIIQELHENFVISEVRVNKHKLRTRHRDSSCTKINKTPSFTPKSCIDNDNGLANSKKQTDETTPSAPTLEKILETESDRIEEVTGDEIFKPHKKAGGLLLKKRLSNSNFIYKSCNLSEPPQKPPRCSLSSEEKLSYSSTAPSIREAERILDEFISMKTRSSNIPKVCSELKDANKFVIKKRKSYPFALQANDRTELKLHPSYPPLFDTERGIDSEKAPCCIKKNGDKPLKISMEFNDENIKHMLNYDARREHPDVSYTCGQSGPQEQKIGWQIPKKLDLDTVDSFERHNLASNFEDKDTPVKSELFSSRHSPNIPKQSTKLTWSNFPPWINKHKQRYNNKETSKHQFCAGSKLFLKTSKEKILRLVSPKKDNKECKTVHISKTPYRNIGIQTSQENIPHRCQNNCHESPPGSYHSPFHSTIPVTSLSTETPNTTNEITNFDFRRTVSSPPKKVTKSIQRKLNFPLDYSDNCQTTYKSFNDELNQDLTLSKMGYILSNIRTKLEIGDEYAQRTFEEIERREAALANIDVASSSKCQNIQQKLRKNLSSSCQPHVYKDKSFHKEPIYSEIEEDSIYISECPNFDNHTGHIEKNLDLLYAKVNKCNKTRKHFNDPHSTMSLGEFVHDSLQCNRTIILKPLSPVPEPPENEINSNLTLDSSQIYHCQSLNNVRVMEHNSPPKKYQQLSKSEFALHRTEVFLDNLCKSDLTLNKNEPLEKMQNNERNKLSYISISQPFSNDSSQKYETYVSKDNGHDVLQRDTVSYDEPTDEIDGRICYDDSSLVSNSESVISLTGNQSTPKKPSFVTKEHISTGNTCIIEDETAATFTNKVDNISHTCSLSDVNVNGNANMDLSKGSLSLNAKAPLKHLKNIFRKSLRKGARLVSNETRCVSSRSIGDKYYTQTQGNCNSFTDAELDNSCSSIQHLESLFSINEAMPVSEQLAKAVHICRNVPELDISPEMVEAERLLLFSTFSSENNSLSLPAKYNQSSDKKTQLHFIIQRMQLTMKENLTQDIFFNYFCIVTFECDGKIKSSQSVECKDGAATFNNCNIEFKLNVDLERERSQLQGVRCNVFMLKLRKVSKLSTTVAGKQVEDSASSVSSSSLSSRFTLYASFYVTIYDFVPFQYPDNKLGDTNAIYMESSRTCTLPLLLHNEWSYFKNQIEISGYAGIQLERRIMAGFLNVNDTQHNWNRRWCTLDGIHLNIWKDCSVSEENFPIINLDLRNIINNIQTPLHVAPREICARPRSFCLRCNQHNTSVERSASLDFFFSADTQDELYTWLNNLNISFEFIKIWLSHLPVSH